MEEYKRLRAAGFTGWPQVPSAKLPAAIALSGRDPAGLQWGTLDSWLAYKLSGAHVTDASAAWLTGYYDYAAGAGWDARVADYAGHYVRDTRVPEDLRGPLADAFDNGAATLDIRFDGQVLSVVLPDETGTLQPLASNRFIAPTVFSTGYTFHRDAGGEVRGLTLSLGEGRAYYRRVPSR
jgi:hypothetical protein